MPQPQHEIRRRHERLDPAPPALAQRVDDVDRRPAAQPVAPRLAPAQRQLEVAKQVADWSIPVLSCFPGAYVVLAALTWFCYLRRSFATRADAEPRARASI
jgi:hypothetical protein